MDANVVIEVSAEELDYQGGYLVSEIEKVTHIVVKGNLPKNFNKEKYEKKGIKLFSG